MKPKWNNTPLGVHEPENPCMYVMYVMSTRNTLSQKSREAKRGSSENNRKQARGKKYDERKKHRQKPKKKKKKKIKSLTFVLIHAKSKTRFSLGKPRHLKGNKGNWESIIRLKQFLTEFHFDLQSDQWSWPLQIKPFTWVQTRKEMERNNSPFPVICVPTETRQRVLQYFTKLAYNVQCTMYVISVLQINHVDSLSERTIDRFPCHATKN